MVGSVSSATQTALPAAPAIEPHDRSRTSSAVAVADRLAELTRLVGRAKAGISEHAPGDSERAARRLMSSLGDGGMRASELADRVQSDLSTVSRHVTTLVRAGLVERRADPVDGRATLLVPTEAGQELIAEDRRRRALFFTEVFEDWNPAELAEFAVQLARFAADYEATYLAWAVTRTTSDETGGRR